MINESKLSIKELSRITNVSEPVLTSIKHWYRKSIECDVYIKITNWYRNYLSGNVEKFNATNLYLKKLQWLQGNQ